MLGASMLALACSAPGDAETASETEDELRAKPAAWTLELRAVAGACLVSGDQGTGIKLPVAQAYVAPKGAKIALRNVGTQTITVATAKTGPGQTPPAAGPTKSLASKKTHTFAAGDPVAVLCNGQMVAMVGGTPGGAPPPEWAGAPTVSGTEPGARCAFPKDPNATCSVCDRAWTCAGPAVPSASLTFTSQAGICRNAQMDWALEPNGLVRAAGAEVGVWRADKTGLRIYLAAAPGGGLQCE